MSMQFVYHHSTSCLDLPEPRRPWTQNPMNILLLSFKDLWVVNTGSGNTKIPFAAFHRLLHPTALKVLEDVIFESKSNFTDVRVQMREYFSWDSGIQRAVVGLNFQGADGVSRRTRRACNCMLGLHSLAWTCAVICEPNWGFVWCSCLICFQFMCSCAQIVTWLFLCFMWKSSCLKNSGIFRSSVDLFEDTKTIQTILSFVSFFWIKCM